MISARSDMLAWHYTTGEKFAAVVATGHLMPSGLMVEPPERDALQQRRLRFINDLDTQ